MGDWKLNLVNLWQSPDERRQKYWLVKSLGGSAELAHRFRDCRLSKIERLFGLDRSNKHAPTQERLALHFKSIKHPCGNLMTRKDYGEKPAPTLIARVAEAIRGAQT